MLVISDICTLITVYINIQQVELAQRESVVTYGFGNIIGNIQVHVVMRGRIKSIVTHYISALGRHYQLIMLASCS